MPNYIFLPVNSSEMQRFAESIAKFLQKNSCGAITGVLYAEGNSNWKRGVLRHMFKGSLSSLTAHDTLYVVSHGAGYPGSRGIGAQLNGTLKRYTMEDLAKLLKSEGLTSSFRDLHMLTCGSGLMNASIIEETHSQDRIGHVTIKQVRDPKLRPELNHRESIARQLCNEMKNRGFKRIQVTGYLGDIIVRPPDRVNIEDYFTGEEMDMTWKVTAM